MLRITCSGPSIRPCGTAGQHLLVGDEDVVRARCRGSPSRACPRASQVSSDRHALAGRGDRHVQHDAALLRVVVGEHRRQGRADRGLAGEELAPVDPEPAVDPDRRAPRVGQVAATGGHQHDALVGDTAERGLRAREVPSVAPRREQHDVVVHDRRQGGRAAVAGQLALGHRHLADRRAPSPSSSGTASAR